MFDPDDEEITDHAIVAMYDPDNEDAFFADEDDDDDDEG